jgi:hypothetical protein
MCGIHVHVCVCVCVCTTGPLLVLHFKTGFRTKIEPLALLGHRLANGEVYCAIGMLHQMDRWVRMCVCVCVRVCVVCV